MSNARKISQLVVGTEVKISNVDSDINNSLTNIISRLDSDEGRVQALNVAAAAASSVAGISDSDLKVVSDLRNDLDSEILFVRNIALSYTNFLYNATAGQTTFQDSDANSATLAYTAGSITVFLNGIKLEADDFTATDGTSIVLTQPAGLSSQLSILCPKLESNLPPVTYSWTGVTRGTKYVGSDITSDDDLGVAVDVDSAGTTVIGGAYKHDDKGAVYVYTNNTQVAKLEASNKVQNDFFGKALTISGDGNSMIIASPGRSNGGMCYLFTLSGSTWSEVQTLVSTDLGTSDQFGTEINVSKDSNYIIISSPRKSALVGVTNHALAGVVYIFSKTGSGSSTYTQQAKLSHSNARPDELFGTKTAINSDGTVAVVANAAHPQGLNGFAIFSRIIVPNFATATLVNSQSSQSSLDQTMNAMLFNSDGTKMFLAGGSSDKIYVFTLSTAYDVSTASRNASADITLTDMTALGNVNPAGMRWNNDGTKLFILNQIFDRIHQYTTSTAYDIASMTHNGHHSFTTTSINSFGFDFNGDGTKIILCNRNGPQLCSYNLSTAYDYSTMSASANATVTLTFTTYPDIVGIAFNHDGTQIFLSSHDTFASVASIKTFTLATAYDITTIVQTPVSSTPTTSGALNVSEGQPRQITFGDDYQHAYLAGITNDRVSVFNVGSPAWTETQTISLPSNQTTFGKGIDISDDGGRIVITSAATTSSGTPIIFIYDKSGSTWSLQSSFVMSSTAADNTTSAAGISGDGNQIAVSDLGYKYYHTGGSGNFPNVGAIKIFEYDGSSWSLKTTLIGSVMGENLGESLAFSKGTIPTVVGGAPQHDVLTGGAFVDDIRGDPGSTLVTRDIGAVYRFVAS